MLEKHVFRRTSLNKCLCSKQTPAQSKISHRVISTVPISLRHFTHVPIHFVHFNDMKIDRWLDLSNSLWGISLHYDLLKFKNNQYFFHVILNMFKCKNSIFLYFSLTLTLVQSWIWPELQEEIYFLIVLTGRSSPVSTYPLCIYWWRSSFQKCFWRKWRRIRDIFVEVRACFDEQGSLNMLSYLQALVILEVKTMKSSRCTLILWHLY